MSNKIVGTLQDVKSFPSARGTMYSIKVNDTMYGTGSVEPKAGRGDTVAFEFTENGKYKNANMKTFSVEAGAPVGASTGGSTGGSSYSDRQPVIARQAALNSAIAFVQLVIEAGALGTTAKAAAEDKYGIIEAMVNEKAEEFYTASTEGRAPGGEPAPTKGGSSVASKADSDGSWQ